MNYFSKLVNHELKRDPITHRYTTGDQELDRFFGFNSSLVLVPNSQRIIELACVNYLLSILGIKNSAVISTQEGYLSSYRTANDEFLKTFFVGTEDEKRSYLLSDIIELFKNKIKQIRSELNSISYYTISTPYPISSEQPIIKVLTSRNWLEELELYRKIINILINKKKDVKLLDKCLEISVTLKQYSTTAPIDCDISSFNDINMLNCENNHRVLCKIICGDNDALYSALCRVKVEGQEITEQEMAPLGEQFNKACDLYDIIYREIMEGYYVYCGINKDQNVYNLSDPNLPKKYISFIEKSEVATLLATNKGLDEDKKRQIIFDIMNMCSTDYSVDVVIELMKNIIAYDGGKFSYPGCFADTSKRHENHRTFICSNGGLF